MEVETLPWRRKRGIPFHNPPADILDRVLADVPKSEYGPEVERQMCDEIKTFLLAGHETSAAMLIWTMWELVKVREDENCYGRGEESVQE